MDSDGDNNVGSSIGDSSFVSHPIKTEVSLSSATFASASPAPASLDSLSTPIVQHDDPFAVITNNAPGFKYKYPQAAPTPDNEDDTVWNKVYTAADSRMYNKHGKNASESRKFRESGETRVLALKMLEDNKAKHAAGIPPRAKAVRKVDGPSMPKKESFTARSMTPSGDTMMSISEKIKSEGRARKAVSVAVSSTQGTPGPANPSGTPQPGISSIGPDVKKGPPKKRGTAAPVKKLPHKRPKTDGHRSNTPSNTNRSSYTPGPRQGSESSNDGTVYCICRGPDDHRMMVNCEGGCEEWYHCSCVNINEDDAKKLLDRFICPKCATPDLHTTYRRLCRNFNIKHEDGEPICREPARVTADPPSKYCSENCKDSFFAHVKSLLRQDDTPSVGGALNVTEVSRIFKEKKTIEEFQKLGQKPRLPQREAAEPGRTVGLDYLTAEEESQLAEIKQKQSTIEDRMRIYKNQHALLKMALARAQALAQQSDLDVKDPCGYDNRLTTNEEDFKEWSEFEEGRTALATNTVLPQRPATRGLLWHSPYSGQAQPENPTLSIPLQNLCLKPKKKCKHANWLKLHNEEFLTMQKRLQGDWGALEREAEGILEGAEVREAMRGYYAGNTVTALF